MTIEQWSVISSAAVAIVAVLASLLTSKRDRDERREAAWTERRQDRLERTYLELAAYLHRSRTQANAIRPFVPPTGEPPAPIPQADIERVQALYVTIASDEVRALFDEFNGVIVSIVSADTAMTGMEDTREETGSAAYPKDWGELSFYDHAQRITSYQHQLAKIEDRIHSQMRHELLELSGRAPEAPGPSPDPA